MARNENRRRFAPISRVATGAASAGGPKCKVFSSTHQSQPVRSAISSMKPKSVSDCSRYSNWVVSGRDDPTCAVSPFSLAIVEITLL